VIEPGLAAPCAFHVFLRDAAQKQAGVVAREAFVQLLLEHLDAGADGLTRLAEADDLAGLAHLDLAAFNSSGDHGAAAGDREDVFDRHQERQVDRARRVGHERVGPRPSARRPWPPTWLRRSRHPEQSRG